MIRSVLGAWQESEMGEVAHMAAEQTQGTMSFPREAATIQADTRTSGRNVNTISLELLIFPEKPEIFV